MPHLVWPARPLLRSWPAVASLHICRFFGTSALPGLSSSPDRSRSRVLSPASSALSHLRWARCAHCEVLGRAHRCLRALHYRLSLSSCLIPPRTSMVSLRRIAARAPGRPPCVLMSPACCASTWHPSTSTWMPLCCTRATARWQPRRVTAWVTRSFFSCHWRWQTSTRSCCASLVPSAQTAQRCGSRRRSPLRGYCVADCWSSTRPAPPSQCTRSSTSRRSRRTDR